MADKTNEAIESLAAMFWGATTLGAVEQAKSIGGHIGIMPCGYRATLRQAVRETFKLIVGRFPTTEELHKIYGKDHK